MSSEICSQQVLRVTSVTSSPRILPKSRSIWGNLSIKHTVWYGGAEEALNLGSRAIYYLCLGDSCSASCSFTCKMMVIMFTSHSSIKSTWIIQVKAFCIQICFFFYHKMLSKDEFRVSQVCSKVQILTFHCFVFSTALLRWCKSGNNLNTRRSSRILTGSFQAWQKVSEGLVR